MRPKLLLGLGLLKAALPYLWGFAAASAADYVVDVKNLFLPALAGAAALSASIIVALSAAPWTTNVTIRSSGNSRIRCFADPARIQISDQVRKFLNLRN